MKFAFALLLAIFFSASASAYDEGIKTQLLYCSEKFSILEVYQENGVTYVSRMLLLDRVRGNPYVYGSISQTSTAVIEAQSVIKTADSLIFKLEDGKQLTIKIIKDVPEETMKIQILSDAENAEIQLNAILDSEGTPLEFYSLDSCEIK